MSTAAPTHHLFHPLLHPCLLSSALALSLWAVPDATWSLFPAIRYGHQRPQQEAGSVQVKGFGVEVQDGGGGQDRNPRPGQPATAEAGGVCLCNTLGRRLPSRPTRSPACLSLFDHHHQQDAVQEEQGEGVYKDSRGSSSSIRRGFGCGSDERAQLGSLAQTHRPADHRAGLANVHARILHALPATRTRYTRGAQDLVLVGHSGHASCGQRRDEDDPRTSGRARQPGVVLWPVQVVVGVCTKDGEQRDRGGNKSTDFYGAARGENAEQG